MTNAEPHDGDRVIVTLTGTWRNTAHGPRLLLDDADVPYALPNRAKVHVLPRNGDHHDFLRAQALEQGLAEAGLDRHDANLRYRATRVLQAVSRRLPGFGQLGLRNAVTLAGAVIIALGNNPPADRPSASSTPLSAD